LSISRSAFLRRSATDTYGAHCEYSEYLSQLLLRLIDVQLGHEAKGAQIDAGDGDFTLEDHLCRAQDSAVPAHAQDKLGAVQLCSGTLRFPGGAEPGAGSLRGDERLELLRGGVGGFNLGMVKDADFFHGCSHNNELKIKQV